MAQYVYDEDRQTMIRPRMNDPRSRGIVRGQPGSMGAAGFSTMGTGGPEARVQEAKAKLAEDAVFNSRQNQFKQTFGRGLTDGQASRRGSAGRTTQVPAGAMPQQQTYWENKQGQPNNNVELAGMMNRGIQRMEKGDKEGIKEFLKGYNDGPWSSRTDAKDVIIKDGMVTLIGEDDQAINTKPVPIEELQNLSGNVFTGQNVYQRDAGAPGMGQGMQPAGPESKSAVKAAEVVGSGNIDKFKSELKALNERASVEKMTPELQAEIENANANLDNAVNMAGKNIYGAGMQGQPGQQVLQPAQVMQQLVDSNKSDDEVRQIMWDRYGDQGVMRGVQSELMNRGKQAGGMQPQAQQPAPPVQTGQGFGGDVSIGPGGQPDVLQQQPAATQAQPQLTQNIKSKSNLSPKAQARQRDETIAILDAGIQAIPTKATGKGHRKGANISSAKRARDESIAKVQRVIDLGMLAGEQLQKARDFVNQ